VTATPDHPAPPGRPAPLTAAASLVAVEALVLVLLGVLEAASLQADKATMGATTALFFLVYGAGLAFCAWGLARPRSWARAPVVVAQIIQLLVAWSFLGGATTWVAVGLGAVAAIVLAGIFHPHSIDALGERR
jgi:hypothetical protein